MTGTHLRWLGAATLWTSACGCAWLAGIQQPSLCGDGVRSGVEACDDGNTVGCDGCKADCSAVEVGCCDPKCRKIDSLGPTPLQEEVPIGSWGVGEIGDLSLAEQFQVVGEPCGDGSACQLDQYCLNPSSGFCAHDICTTGPSLRSSCDSCASRICLTEPGCCNTPVIGTCPHDLCSVGTALVKGNACHPCVATICDDPLYSACCDTAQGAWSTVCVKQVTDKCGLTCETGVWTQDCVSQVDSLCGARCLADPEPPTCDHHPCLLGGPLDPACDPCVDQVCADNPSCCTTEWDSFCLNQLVTVCADFCPAKGKCVPWLPTETDHRCATFDLTVGIPCQDQAGNPSIPICNRGTTTSPAGVPVFEFPPAGALLIPSSSPPVGIGWLCGAVGPIPPGECVNFVGCPSAESGAQLVVNPQSAEGADASECQINNNWSIVPENLKECALPDCTGASHALRFRERKIFLSVEKASSMNQPLSDSPGSLTRWSATADALTTFVQDPASTGLGVWLGLWPDNTIASCPKPFPGGCGDGFCKVGNVDGFLVAAPAPTDITEAAFVTALQGATPGGERPTFPAFAGVTSKSIEFKLANPDRDVAVVLVTDGPPNQCAADAEDLAILARQAAGYGVKVYVVGLTALASSVVQKIGAGSGGRSFLILDDSEVPANAQILAALREVREDFIPCRFALPDNPLFDPSHAVVTYEPAGGAPISIPEIEDACGGSEGWHYDNPSNPSVVVLCPTTCEAVRAGGPAQLTIGISCIERFVPMEYKEIHKAECPPGTAPRWGYFSYEASTPSDSKVRLRARTSDTPSFDFPAPPPFAEVSASADNQSCSLGGPAPSCPVDLPAVLGGLPASGRRYLELVMDLEPSTDKTVTSRVSHWQLTYACPDL